MDIIKSSNSLYRNRKIRNFSIRGINVASPCYVLPSGGTCKGAVHFLIGFPNTFCLECYRVPCFFYAFAGRISNNPHEFMEPRRVLLPLRSIAAPADCTRPLPGSGRNRYVAAAPVRNRTPGLAAQNSKSRLNGWPFKIWSCCPAPDGCRPHVCAASTGRGFQPAPGGGCRCYDEAKTDFCPAAPFSDPPTKPTI